MSVKQKVKIKRKSTNYKNNPNLKAAGVEVQLEDWQVDELMKCMDDPIYFIESYVKIIHVDRGLIPFKLYEYQKRYITSLHSHRHTCSKWSRQSGKSTSTIAYYLHMILFNEDKVIGILANKGATARELLSRLKLAYENLPFWMQVGVSSWNKGSIELGNGCKVLAASTSSSSIRGMSMYAILLDEFAFLHPNMAMDFFESTYPVISSGETTRINIVSTPNGMNHFYKMWQEAIEKRSQFVPIEIDWWEVPGRDEKWKAETIANIGEEAFEQEYGGSFLGSANTLFQTSVLRKLVHKNPIYTIGDLKIFDAPISEHQYVITSDTAEGIGGDYTTFIVHDVTEYPFKQVARYKSNTVSHLVFPDILYTSANQYNEAWVLVELNSTGRQVAEILQNDLEYENILFTSANSRKKEMLMLGSGNLPGVKTTKSTKRVGCNNIKQLVENNKYLIQDFDTLQEASTFVRYGNSFASEPGGHDDLMMCLVLFGWLNTQDFFGHLMDKNMRKDLYEALSQKINEEIPLGIMTARDLQEKRIVENGVVWEKVK